METFNTYKRKKQSDSSNIYSFNRKLTKARLCRPKNKKATNNCGFL